MSHPIFLYFLFAFYFLFYILNECKLFIQEEYDFRKSYSENPEQLFLELTRRCKRPDLWIERISGEMEIPLEKQHRLIREICFKTLTLLYNTLKGEKNELLNPDFPFFSYWWIDDDWDTQTMEDIVETVKITSKYCGNWKNSPNELSSEEIVRTEKEKKEQLIRNLLKTVPHMLDNLHKKGMLIFDKEIKKMTTNIIFYGLQKLHEKIMSTKRYFLL